MRRVRVAAHRQSSIFFSICHDFPISIKKMIEYDLEQALVFGEEDAIFAVLSIL